MKDARGIVLGCIAILAALVPCVSSAQTVGLYADASGSICNLAVRPGQVTRAYLVFHPAGLSGIQGLALGIRGLPPGWFGFVDDPGCNIECPGPFEDGAVFAWPSCQTQDPLLVASVSIVATTEERDVGLVVGPRLPLIHPGMECPFVALCDDPVFTAVCIEGQTTYINSSNSCMVAVHAESWGGVRELYR